MFYCLLADTKQELADLMKGDKVTTKDYLVVDVRNDDYAGGNIRNSLNQPSGEFFTSNINALVERTKDVPLVIFHCALSQQRYVGIMLDDLRCF